MLSYHPLLGLSDVLGAINACIEVCGAIYRLGAY